jgi:Cu(I)/Ag(I) efflux system membrane protein CusA/SilA
MRRRILLILASILIVTLPLPLAVLCSFLLMHYANVTSNVMSLAGIAIAIGVLVDAGIVVTENAFRRLECVDTHHRGKLMETVLRATKLVGRPTFFSMAIIVLAFVPVFALTGRSPVGNAYLAGIDPPTAQFLQTVAWETVQDYYQK